MKKIERMLPVALLLLALPAVIQAQYTYTTNNSTITITQYACSGGTVTIPSTINGLPVTSIGDHAFYGCTGLVSIIIPNSITNIGDWAFSQCANLNSVTIPNSVTSIGNEAFNGCTSLAAITVGAANSVYCSTAGVLFNKNKTTLIQCPASKAGSYTIPNTVTIIEDWAFDSCRNLTSITIPNSVTSIGFSAFIYCWNLTSITIPNSVTSIGDYAFTTCIRLTNIVIGNSVIGIGEGAFAGCNSLISVTIPNSVTSIGNVAFTSCYGLTAITVDATNSAYSSVDGVLFNKSQTTLIQCPGGKVGSYPVPNSVTWIGDRAFESCGRLTNITISSSVTSIEDKAFTSCYGLTAITVDATNSVYCSVDGVLFNKNQTALIRCPGGKVGSYTVPSSVTSIGSHAFSQCTGLISITIPDSVTSIEEKAFDYCRSLTGVYFLGNAPSVGSFAFDGDNNATVYYLARTTGWGPTFADRPTVLWNPQVQTSDATFGVQTNQFGFNVAWAGGQVVVVEACTDLANPTWSPLQTNTLSGDLFYFSDPQWTNYPSRFYRLRSP